MAVFVYCSDARALLAEIEARVASGKALTWEIDKTTHKITHSPIQWYHQAYLRGKVNEENDCITFLFSLGKGTAGQDAKTGEQSYPIYHGRLISFLFDDFYGRFRTLAARGTYGIQTKPSSGAMKLPPKRP